MERKDRKIEVTQSGQQNKNSLKKSKQKFRDLRNCKSSNIYAIEVSGEKKEDEQKNIFKEVMAEKFPNLAKDVNLWIQESK